MQVAQLETIIYNSNNKDKIFINNKGFGNNGLLYLTQHCNNIIDFCAIRNGITFEGVMHLTITNWSRLQSIDLSYNPIGAKGCKYLSRGQWPLLEMLWLVGNEFGSDNRYSIGTEGLNHLSKSQWPSLKMIKISQNDIGSSGIKVLCKTSWTNLKKLDMNMNKQREFDINYLSLVDFADLQSLKINKNQLSHEQLKKTSEWLKNKFPYITELVV